MHRPAAANPVPPFQAPPLLACPPEPPDAGTGTRTGACRRLILRCASHRHLPNRRRLRSSFPLRAGSDLCAGQARRRRNIPTRVTRITPARASAIEASRMEKTPFARAGSRRSGTSLLVSVERALHPSFSFVYRPGERGRYHRRALDGDVEPCGSRQQSCW
jgi:hypothetical protein